MHVEPVEPAKTGAAHRAIPYLLSGVFVIVTFLIRLALAPVLEQRSPLLPFIPAVVLAAGIYGARPGLLAVVLSIIFATWAFILPGQIGLTADQFASIAVFIVTSIATLVFANHLRAARSRAETLEIELIQAQTTAAMGTMAATLAHELNQPLTAASNYVAACGQLASLIKDEKQASLVKGLGQAELQIQRAGSIIRSARSLIRNAPTDRLHSSVTRMFERVIELIRATEIGAHATFRTNVQSGADSVIANTIQIEQVLVNIVRNACEATLETPGRARISFKATGTDRGTLIEIRDNGRGIPRDRIASLFTAARNSTTAGLGIGLSICRTIVESHGGSIWAQNNPEGGASFFVLLPSEDGED